MKKNLSIYQHLQIIAFLFMIFPCLGNENYLTALSVAPPSGKPDISDQIINESTVGRGEFYFNVKELGATGNGVDDDSPAIQVALTNAGQSGHGVVYLPEGIYRLTEPVIWARLSGPRTLSGLTIRGEGVGKTIILVDNDQGGFLLDDFYSLTQFQVRNMTFIAARQGAGVALSVGKRGNRMGVRGYRCFTGENLEIKGQSPADYFNKGVIVEDLYRPMFRNISFTGSTIPGDEYNASIGIGADGCYSPDLEDCRVSYAYLGFSYVLKPGEKDEGPEAGTFSRCVADYCVIGIDIDTPINEPELGIIYCNIRARDIGIRISRRKFYQVRNNIFEPLLDPALHEYKDISTLGSFMGVYHRNIFRKYQGGNSTEDNRTCLSFDDSGWIRDNREMIITNNIFPDAGTDVGGALFGTMQESSIIKDNDYAGTLGAGEVKKRIFYGEMEPVNPPEIVPTGPVFSVADFGARGNDLADDSDAFQAAVDALIAHGNGVLYIPAGKFFVNKAIEMDIPPGAPAGKIAIYGEGPGVSQIVCNNPVGAFRILDHSGRMAFELKNLGFYANENEATAIYMESNEKQLQEYRTLEVRNIDIQPYDDNFDLEIIFKNGLVAKGFSNPLFFNFIFNSYARPSFDPPLNMMSKYGVYLEDCDNLTFLYCYSWKSKFGYYIKGETCNNSYFYRVRGVNGLHGLYMDLRKPSTGLWIANSHFNRTLSNIYLKNMNDFVIIDNLPYGPANENKLNDIELDQCRNGHIIGNVYQAPGLENLRDLPLSNRNTVYIRGERSGNILIEKNIYNAKGRALVMEEGIDGVVVKDNLYPNTRVDRTNTGPR